MSHISYSNASRNNQTDSSSISRQIAQDMLLFNALNQAGSRLTVDNNFNRNCTNSNDINNNTVSNSVAVSNQPSHCVYTSEIEQAILRSNLPLELNENEEIVVNGEKGFWLNKNEITNWKGSCPLSQYQING
jgi:hypothetical protein